MAGCNINGMGPRIVLAMHTVISQSMYFPWVGMLEQMRLADVFIHYDDVQYVRGFFNRVQIKTTAGLRWLTVPLRDIHRGQCINEVIPDDRQDWRQDHRRLLIQAYQSCPHVAEMIDVFDTVVLQPARSLADISRTSMLVLGEYFGLCNDRRFAQSTEIGVIGKSSERLLGLCKAVDADTYLTGHGARNYLDHSLFESAGIRVKYMNYQCLSYPQMHGPFTPYVSALDLIANCGQAGRGYICSTSKNWKEFLYAPG